LRNLLRPGGRQADWARLFIFVIGFNGRGLEHHWRRALRAGTSQIDHRAGATPFGCAVAVGSLTATGETACAEPSGLGDSGGAAAAIRGESNRRALRFCGRGERHQTEAGNHERARHMAKHQKTPTQFCDATLVRARGFRARKDLSLFQLH
jgi:hypothetical protein